MASYRLTSDEVKAFLKSADMYIERESNYRQWAPIRTAPWAKTNEWYVLTRFEVPRGSQDGRDFVEVATSRETGTANQISYTYKFVLPFGDVEQARRNGVPIWSENVQVAAKQMDYQIAHLALEGEHSWDEVAVSGLREGGTENANDASAWDTVTKPEVHAAAGWGALETAGFTGPYTWIMSSNLGAGIRKKYGAGDGPQHTIIGPQYQIDQMVFLPLGTSTRNRLYPIAPADTDDGVWFMFKKDPSVWRIAEFAPPQTTINPELNQDLYAYEGFMRWRGTVEIVQSTGIQYDPDVDLA